MFHAYPIGGFAEPISCWSHLGAAGVFFFLNLFLIRRGSSSRVHFFSLLVFSLSNVFLLSMSGVYHLLPLDGGARLVLRYLDHAAIFVLIAGTFTAVHGLLFTGVWRWGMISTVWLAAIVCIALKMVFFNDTPELLGLLLYLGLGWMGLISATLLWRKFGFAFIEPLLLGALAYTLGGVVDFLAQPVLIKGIFGPHELFHVAVLLGLSWHWCFINRSLSCTIAIAGE